MLHCRATFCRATFSGIWRGVAWESRYTCMKGPTAPTFSALTGGVAPASSWKVSQYRTGGCRSYCRLSRYNGPLKSMDQSLGALFSGNICTDLSAPNHKSQIASDLKSRSPNRKNFPQIAVSSGSNRTFKSRDLWFEPLFKSPLESQCPFPVQVVRTMSSYEKVHSVSNR